MFSRRTRRLIALLIWFALMFSNIAVAAYACPMMSQSAAASQAVMVAESDTDASAPSQPSLCYKHCEDGQQNVNDLPDVPTPAFFSAFVVSSPVIEPASVSIAVFPPELLHATSPPLAIRHCCFRI